MKKNGFTLVELLAVIILLAVIALIATPLILNVINDARESATQDSVAGIYHAIEIDYAERLEFSGTESYTYNNGVLVPASDNSKQIALSGSLGNGASATGTVNNGVIKVAAWVGDKCYVKLASKDTPSVDNTVTSEANCLTIPER